MNRLEEGLRDVIEGIVRVELAKALAVRTAEAPAMLTIRQAAERLGMSASYIRAAIRDDRLPAVRIGRAVRVRVADVDAFPVRRRKPRHSPALRAERILGLARDTR